MTIKVYISGICGSQEVRKHQQRVLFILQSMPIDLQVIDVTEPGRDDDLIFMQEEAKKHDKKTQLPPQIFNDNEYCGDYSDFELANDDDEIMRFLKLESSSKSEVMENEPPGDTIIQNGISNHENGSEAEKETVDIFGDQNSIETNKVNPPEEQSSMELKSDELNETENEKLPTDVNEIASEAVTEIKEESAHEPTEGEKVESEEESEEESE